LNIVRLRILREVAQRGSLSGAAAALGYTTSAVSQQISTLEREAGVVLVERLPRGIRLTEPGRALLHRAERILAELHEAELELATFSAAAFGRLRIGTFAAANGLLVPQAVTTFQQRFPDVDVVLTDIVCDETVFSLAEQRLDVALVYEFRNIPFNAQDDVQLTRLLDDPMHVILPSGHRLADRDLVSMRDLAEENWIADVRDTVGGKALTLACGEAGFDPRVVVQVDDQIAVQRLVSAGAGVSVVSSLLVGLLRADIVVRDLAGPGLTRTVSIATSTGPATPEWGTAFKYALERAGEAFRRGELRRFSVSEHGTPRHNRAHGDFEGRPDRARLCPTCGRGRI
jgi:DNA-binding transcriptional LysR family regulator